MVGTLYRPFCCRQPEPFHKFFLPSLPASLFLLLISNSALQPVSKRPLLALYKAYLETPTQTSKIQKAPVRVLTGALIQALILVLK